MDDEATRLTDRKTIKLALGMAREEERSFADEMRSRGSTNPQETAALADAERNIAAFERVLYRYFAFQRTLPFDRRGDSSYAA